MTNISFVCCVVMISLGQYDKKKDKNQPPQAYEFNLTILLIKVLKPRIYKIKCKQAHCTHNPKPTERSIFLSKLCKHLF